MSLQKQLVLSVSVAAVIMLVVAVGVGSRTGRGNPSAHRPEASTEDIVLDRRAAMARLEEAVVAGSAREGADAACLADEVGRVATVDATAAQLRLLARGDGDNAHARAVMATLDEAMVPLRRCVGCAQPKEGCGAAARALVRLENDFVAAERFAADAKAAAEGLGLEKAKRADRLFAQPACIPGLSCRRDWD